MGKQPIVIERSMQNHSMAAIRKQDMMRGMQAYDDWCTAARAAAETTPALDIAPRLDRAHHGHGRALLTSPAGNQGTRPGRGGARRAVRGGQDPGRPRLGSA